MLYRQPELTDDDLLELVCGNKISTSKNGDKQQRQRRQPLFCRFVRCSRVRFWAHIFCSSKIVPLGSMSSLAPIEYRTGTRRRPGIPWKMPLFEWVWISIDETVCQSHTLSQYTLFTGCPRYRKYCRVFSESAGTVFVLTKNIIYLVIIWSRVYLWIPYDIDTYGGSRLRHSAPLYRFTIRIMSSECRTPSALAFRKYAYLEFQYVL